MATVISDGILNKDSNQSSYRCDLPVISDQEFYQLRDFIYAHSGIDLANHKRALLCSRLAKRLRYYGIRSYSDYFDLLTKNDPEGHELVHMINAITTNKTEFFRENHHFQFLSDHVFPEIKETFAKNNGKRLRFWSAGTATGEEAYSLAMIVKEFFSKDIGWDIKILASDIDTNVLAHAARGIYTYEQIRNVPKDLLQHYFLKGINNKKSHVMAKREIKDLISLHHLNLQDDIWPMNGKFNVIFCRNVIIYFNKITQKKLIEHLTRYLVKDGYLMLGHSESLHGIHSSFRHVGHSVYQYIGEE